jgi:hypothetical protein
MLRALARRWQTKAPSAALRPRGRGHRVPDRHPADRPHHEGPTESVARRGLASAQGHRVSAALVYRGCRIRPGRHVAHGTATGELPRLVLVVGVAGAGKSTVGRLLADRLGWDYRDVDEFHSEAKRAKMAAGHALAASDRAPWLEAIAHVDEIAAGVARAGVHGSGPPSRRTAGRPPGRRQAGLLLTPARWSRPSEKHAGGDIVRAVQGRRGSRPDQSGRMRHFCAANSASESTLCSLS